MTFTARMPGTKNAAPTSTYRIRSILQLITKSYNEGETQDKATSVVVACRGGARWFLGEISLMD